VSLPDRIAEPVRGALDAHGYGRRIARVVEVAGGCINRGARVDTDGGASLFLKWNERAALGMFAAEAAGLAALAAAGAVRVPSPVAWSGEAGPTTASTAEGEAAGASWLLMEYVAPGRASPEADERLGTRLASLHASAPTSGGFGWERDNWIGSLSQANAVSESWAEFWRERRLVPQLQRARARGQCVEAAFDDVVGLTSVALADVLTPDLVHGDLWGGNWFATQQGEPVLIDPAPYRGHGEVDLAMSELFGGFDARFYRAYREARGISDAYVAYLRDLYQLYYLLAHVNLFGASYEAASLRAAQRVTAALAP
jgi:fructosamine-3-kinase